MEPTTSSTPAGGGEPIRGHNNGLKERGKWANKMEFRLAMAGAIIGLGSIWHFAFLFYTSGGAMYLVPYMMCLIFCGMPMFFLETAVGQYTGESPFTAWRKICPMFQGIGIASQVIVVYHSISNSVVLAWTLFYLYNSFKNPLSWSHCNNVWKTVDCRNQSITDDDWSFLFNNSAGDESNYTWPTWSYPEDDFWRSHVWGGPDHDFLSPGALGKLRWGLVLCLLLAWVACYFCIWKGVKYAGKVLYFTVAFPFPLLLILFIRGATLPGAWNGIRHYIFPDISQIAYSRVWYYAASEVLYSFSLCHGVLTTIGSYNRYKHDCYKDCLLFCALASGVSIFSGLVLFSLVGYGAHSAGVPVYSFMENAWMDVLFVSVPKVLSQLPVPQFWCVLFFLMMLFFTLSSQFLFMESLVTTITDIFPHALRKPARHEVLVLLAVLICFLLGLPLVTEKGSKVFIILETFSLSGTSLMFIVCLESIVIGWIYGANRFYDNIEDMIGYRPYPVMKYCWLFVIPLLSVVCIIFSLANAEFRPLPSLIGMSLMLAPILSIPIFVLVSVSKHEDVITTSASSLKQAYGHKPRLSLCKRVILAGQKSDGKQAGEEKPATDSTTGV